MRAAMVRELEKKSEDLEAELQNTRKINAVFWKPKSKGWTSVYNVQSRYVPHSMSRGANAIN